MPNQKIELVKGGRKVDGVFEPITTKDLAVSATPVVTPPKPATQAPGMIAEIGANADALTQRLADERAARQEQMQGSSSDLQNFLTQLKGETQLTNEAYAQDGGVDAVGKELQDINQKILAEQVALQRRLETIEKKGGGLVSGMQAEMDSVERESLRKQADLSVIQMGIQGRYDSAKAIADRAVSAYMEKQKLKLDALQFNYQNNKDLFSIAEQREFEVMFDQLKRESNREEENLKQISDLSINALTNGAPTEIAEQMRSAKTVADAISIGGKYVNALERRKNLAQIYADEMSVQLDQIKINEEKRKQKAMEEAIASGEIILSPEQQDVAMKLGKEFEGESAEFKSQVSSYNRITASAKDPSPAGDLALIFNYMKMLDPGSTVREGEFANAQNAANVPDIIRAKYNKITQGTRLEDGQREDFVQRATEIYNTSLEQQMELESRYRDKATSLFGLPDNAATKVIQDIRAVGSVSEVAFGIVLDGLSTDQMESLMKEGLYPVSTKPQ